MWDEQERFAKGCSKVFQWLMVTVGVILMATSLVSGDPQHFFGFVQILGGLAILVLAYGLAAASAGGVLLGITCGASYCFRWFKNHFLNQPKDR